MSAMKIFLTFALITFLSVAPAHAVGHHQPLCELDGSQREINACAAQRFSQADDEMNRLYHRQMQRSSSRNKDSLRQSQRAWVLFRDRACEYEAGPRKDLRSLMLGIDLLCRSSLTEQRNETLKQYLACTGAPCPGI